VRQPNISDTHTTAPADEGFDRCGGCDLQLRRVTASHSELSLDALVKGFPSWRRPRFAPFFLQDLRWLADRGWHVQLHAALPWLAGPARRSQVDSRIELQLRRYHSFSQLGPDREWLARFSDRQSTRSLARSLQTPRRSGAAAYLKFLNCAPLLPTLNPGQVKVLSIGEGVDTLRLRAKHFDGCRLDRVLAFADWIEVRNQEVATYMGHLYGCEERIRVLGSGVDTTFFCPGDRAVARRAIGIPEKSFVVAFVGIAHSHKGAELAMEATALLSGCTLVTAGASWRNFRSRHLLNLGVRDARGIRALLRAADVFLFPSADEGMSNALLEALACGTPCVVADACHTAFLKHGIDCLKVQGRQARDWMNALARLQEDTTLSSALSMSGIAVASDLSMVRRIEALEELLCHKHSNNA
jgi:glycosyltransferase involved in cell wall biosynthesis